MQEIFKAIQDLHDDYNMAIDSIEERVLKLEQRKE